MTTQEEEHEGPNDDDAGRFREDGIRSLHLGAELWAEMRHLAQGQALSVVTHE